LLEAETHIIGPWFGAGKVGLLLSRISCDVCSHGRATPEAERRRVLKSGTAKLKPFWRSPDKHSHSLPKAYCAPVRRIIRVQCVIEDAVTGWSSRRIRPHSLLHYPCNLISHDAEPARRRITKRVLIVHRVLRVEMTWVERIAETSSLVRERYHDTNGRPQPRD
jgi:hypothetical protein